MPQIGFELGGGGAIRAIGGAGCVVWGIVCIVGCVVFYRRGRIVSFAFLAALLAAYPGAVVGAPEVTRSPWGIAVYTTVGLFVGLAAGLAFPASRRARSGSPEFFLISAGAFVLFLIAGEVMILAAMDAPWNCAAQCHLPTVMTLFTIDALTLITVTVVLAVVAWRTERVSEPRTAEAPRSGSG